VLLCTSYPSQAAPTRQTGLPAPENFVATAVSPRQVNLSWDEVPDAFSYEVERKADGEAEFIDPGLPNPQGTFTFDTSVTPGTTYTYRVRSARESLRSPWTETRVTVPREPQPFGGVPATLPGTVVAVNFDEGGEGVAYSDSDPSNNGGFFRLNEGVDVQRSSDPTDTSPNAANVGWIRNGEWIGYTVEVQQFGSYTLTMRVASPFSSGKARIEFGGENKTGTITIPNTGGWQNWQDITITGFTLPTGRQFMRFVVEGERFNVRSFTFTRNP
nr:carbohydrate-binding protein [Chloroflexaceae bacterium]